MSFFKKASERLQIIGHALRIGNVAAARNADEAVNKAQMDAVRPYKRYVAILSQSGTAAPVAIILENTLGGTLVWSRNSDGYYTATLSNAFTASKTVAKIGNVDDQIASGYLAVISGVGTSTIQIGTGQSGGGGLDGLMYSTYFEIRVYP